MNNNPPAYGLWTLVVINTLIFFFFALSFTRPRTKRDWRTLGAFSAFLVALFTEMYGFPLTIYLLSGWLSSRFPMINPFSHVSGHLWQTLLGLKANPHLSPIHLLSEVFIGGGFILIAIAWKMLFRAQGAHTLAVTGIYARMRHPQYTGFVIIMLGFLIQWPTIPTMVMFPILIYMYVRLAGREEKEMAKEFGDAYAQYAARTPALFPRFVRSAYLP